MYTESQECPSRSINIFKVNAVEWDIPTSKRFNTFPHTTHSSASPQKKSATFFILASIMTWQMTKYFPLYNLTYDFIFNDTFSLNFDKDNLSQHWYKIYKNIKKTYGSVEYVKASNTFFSRICRKYNPLVTMNIYIFWVYIRMIYAQFVIAVIRIDLNQNTLKL